MIAPSELMFESNFASNWSGSETRANRAIPRSSNLRTDRGGQITLTDEECQCVTHMTKVIHLLLGS
jgi:hypothetical protein